LSGLPSTPFGGPGMTKGMIRITWHLATIAFLTIGISLVLAGSILHGDAARSVGLVGAGASTGVAALIIGGAVGEVRRAFTTRDWRPLFHPAPALVAAVTVLA